MHMLKLFVCGLALWVPAAALAADKTVDDLLKESAESLKKGKLEEALNSASKAVDLFPKDPRTWLLRAKVREALDKHEDAVADFGKVIELDSKNAEAYNRRGGEQFKLGHIKESIEDFDKFLAL